MSGVALGGQESSRGRIIFFVLLILIGLTALFAFRSTGPMGIEERFSTALGIVPGGGSPEGEVAQGFSLEGQPVAYVIVLLLLGMLCWVLYRKFGA